MNLKSMTIDALVGLKGRIDAVLASKVSDERRALETELAKLTRFEFGRLAFKVPWTWSKGKSCAEIPQPRKSDGNMGRARAETSLARGGDQIRKEAR